VFLNTPKIYKMKHLTKKRKTNKKIAKTKRQRKYKSHHPKIQNKKKRR